MPKEKYVLGRRLGAGAFGEVVEAQSTNTEKLTYAIKIQYDKYLEGDIWLNQMNTEAHIAKEMGLALESYVITRTNPETQRAQKHHYTVMHKLPQNDLRRVINEANSITLHVFLREYLLLVNQLEALHKKGYLHCDIKPENIIMGNPPRIVDFGLCLNCQNYETVCSGIQSGYQGTPNYAPPEHKDAAFNTFFHGEILYTEKTDSYALAKSMQEYFLSIPGFSDSSEATEIYAFFGKAMAADPKDRLPVSEVKSFLKSKIKELDLQEKQEEPLSPLHLVDHLLNTAIEIFYRQQRGFYYQNLSENSFVFSNTHPFLIIKENDANLNRTGISVLDYSDSKQARAAAGNETEAFKQASYALLQKYGKSTNKKLTEKLKKCKDMEEAKNILLKMQENFWYKKENEMDFLEKILHSLKNLLARIFRKKDTGYVALKEESAPSIPESYQKIPSDKKSSKHPKGKKRFFVAFDKRDTAPKGADPNITDLTPESKNRLQK